MIALSFLSLAIIAAIATFILRRTQIVRYLGAVTGLFLVVSAVTLFTSMYSEVKQGYMGVVTSLGKITDQPALPAGPHFIKPWEKMNLVFVGMDSAKVDNTEAGSSDAQKVHSTLTVNFHVIPSKAKDLFAMNPGLDYEAQFLAPGIPDVFKSVVSKYSAADLLVKRNELNQQVVAALNDKFHQYHVRVTGVNLVNFGFSKSFNDAIEEKVTETERAKTAENRLRRVQADAASKIAEAEGTAKAIAIQAAAIEKQGGDKYVQLEAIKKWDGKMPSTTGGAMPFVNVGK